MTKVKPPGIASIVMACLMFLYGGCDKSLINLRSTPASLSENDVNVMLIEKGFYDRGRNEAGVGLPNNYEMLTDGKVILDQSTGLMWQQFGSSEKMSYEETEGYIAKLNLEKFAGYNDWRLPTLEEAMSLMKPVKDTSLVIDENLPSILMPIYRHIAPVFDDTQWIISTADLCVNTSAVWLVDFVYGGCGLSDVNILGYVRAVRSGQ